MNTRLEKLFEKYHLPEQERYEINQIFWLLPPNKQTNLLNNFDTLMVKFEQIHKEIDLERRILVWDLDWDIKMFYKKFWNQIESLQK